MFNLNPNFISTAIKYFAVIMVVLILFFLVKACSEQLKSPVQESIVIEAPVVKHYIDDSGKKHTEVASIIVRSRNSLDNHYQHIIDSLSLMLKSRPQSIEAVVTVGTNTTGTFKPEILIDTSQKLKDATVDYHDKYLKLHGNLNKDSIWRYSVMDSLTIVTYQKRKGWFGRQLYLDATAMNPNTFIKGITSVEISGYKPNKWGIGINVGYGYNGVTWSPTIGVGIQRNFIRF